MASLARQVRQFLISYHWLVLMILVGSRVLMKGLIREFLGVLHVNDVGNSEY